MSMIWVVLAYVVALAAALTLLLRYRARARYWHLLAIAIALALGLTPPPAGWQGPLFDLGCGSAFVVLLVWGAGGFLLPARKRA
jgi:hypothetical protein